MLAVLLLTLTVTVVHVPMKPDPTWYPTWREIERLRPGLYTLRHYEGTTVQRMPGEIVVVLTKDKSLRKGRLAIAGYDRGLIVVFVREVERLLDMDIGNPRARIALGHIIAHELEHIRRQSASHDAEGFFRSCYSREYLLTLDAR